MQHELCVFFIEIVVFKDYRAVGGEMEHFLAIQHWLEGKRIPFAVEGLRIRLLIPLGRGASAFLHCRDPKKVAPALLSEGTSIEGRTSVPGALAWIRNECVRIEGAARDHLARSGFYDRPGTYQGDLPVLLERLAVAGLAPRVWEHKRVYLNALETLGVFYFDLKTRRWVGRMHDKTNPTEILIRIRTVTENIS